MNDSDKPASTDSPTPADAPQDAASPAAEKSGATDYAALLDAHKGKLAVGVAATLGLLVYYNLKKKTLPEEDPEGYARLLKLKDNLRQQNAKKAEPRHPRQAGTRAAGAEPAKKPEESDAGATGLPAPRANNRNE